MANHSDISKNFIPYELAVKLKELGFKEKCFAKFRSGSFQFNVLGKPINHNTEQIVPGDVSAPLWQQAFEFFIDKGFWSEVYPDNSQFVENTKSWFYIIKKGTVSTGKYDTYEQARLGCIQGLIELAC